MAETLHAGRQQPRSLSIPEGHTLILDAVSRRQMNQLHIREGLVRVAYSSCSVEAAQRLPITIGFLQGGDQVPLEMLHHSCLHLEAIQRTSLSEALQPDPVSEAITLADWTASLLVIQHLADSETRLRALLRLLVTRLGQRRGPWYFLPMRLKHECLAELVNHSRVTVSRHMSRWRQQGWIEPGVGGAAQLLIAPALIEELAD
ncbi:MAG: helix-turn-helix domain-containing protein [Synechococcaceae cyanobacterium]|nr:helix-turn-helix domain-containing protein [Synechococcaceae cyanobacterium]